jgi:hypothetical protein
MATGIGLMLFSEWRTGITSDYSPIWSFLVPGIVVSVLLFLGCSELEDHETVARPQPQAAGAALVFISVAFCALVLSLFTPTTTPFVDYGPAELIRNAFVALAVGYLTVIVAGWRHAPYAGSLDDGVANSLRRDPKRFAILLRLPECRRPLGDRHCSSGGSAAGHAGGVEHRQMTRPRMTLRTIRRRADECPPRHGHRCATTGQWFG